MRTTVFATLLLLALATAANASIIADVITLHGPEPLVNSTEIVCTYDIVITVEDDNFSAAGSLIIGEPWAEITDGPGTFYYAPTPPDWHWPTYAPIPGTQDDTFVTSPDCWPNTEWPGMPPGFATPPNPDFGDTYIIGDWFVAGLQPTNGTFVIARMAVLCGNQPSTLEIDLAYGGINPGLFNLQRTIVVPTPEPGMAALLALGALAALRRR